MLTVLQIVPLAEAQLPAPLQLASVQPGTLAVQTLCGSALVSLGATNEQVPGEAGRLQAEQPVAAVGGAPPQFEGDLSQQTPSVQYAVPRHSLSGISGFAPTVQAWPSALRAMQVPPLQ